VRLQANASKATIARIPNVLLLLMCSLLVIFFVEASGKGFNRVFLPGAAEVFFAKRGPTPVGRVRPLPVSVYSELLHERSVAL
jgi:hypothetical protein